MNSTIADTKDIIVECIHTLFDDHFPTPEEVADAIVKGLVLEQEWAVAEYDADGNLSQVSSHDYEFSTVHRTYAFLQKKIDNGMAIAGSVGMVSRLFAGWTKV
jgi:hypothetical protein